MNPPPPQLCRRIVAVVTKLLLKIIMPLFLTPKQRCCHSLQQCFLPSTLITQRLTGHKNYNYGCRSSLATIGTLTQKHDGAARSRSTSSIRPPNNYLHRATVSRLNSNSPASGQNDGERHESKKENDISMTNNNNGGVAAASIVKHYLSQLEYDGKVSAEEATSISDALLFSNPVILDNSNKNDNDAQHNINFFSRVLQTSIESYMVQKESRRKSGSSPIQNVGGYVQTIVRNQLLGMKGVLHANQQLHQQQQQNNLPQIDDKSIHSILQSSIQKGYIHQNELDESCIQALNQTSTAIAQYALEGYIRQKKRRLVKNLKPILDPSSYVLKILRNSPRDITPNQPLLERGVATNSSSSHQLQQSQPTRNESNDIQTPPPKTKTNQKSVTMSQVDTTLHHLRKLEQPISTLKGVGPKTELAFHKLGIYTLRDLLWHFPRSFIDRSILQTDIRTVSEGDIGTVSLKIVRKETAKSGSNTISCIDDSGNIVDVSFFYGWTPPGMKMASNKYKEICQLDSNIIVSGKVQHSSHRSKFFNPDKVVSSDEAENVLGIEPVYALSSGLRESVLLSSIQEALQVAKHLLVCLPESLSDDALEVLSWPKLVDALVLTHQPASMDETTPTSPSRQRLAFEELCVQQAQLALMRWNLKYKNFHPIEQRQQLRLPTPSWSESPLVSSAVKALPFQLTQSQKDCLDEMWSDAIGDADSRMVRLLQGDVGSGKTVLAYLLALGCIESHQGGNVAAILVPTQLLALQHASTISTFVSALSGKIDHSSSIKNIHVEILTGSVTGKSRDVLFQRLQATRDEDAVFLIGTHALVTPEIVNRLQQLPLVSNSSSKGLALSVVDEEQRFGVMQREALSSCAANSLFMSATPIPRTLSLKGRSGLMDYTQLVAETNRSVKTTIASAKDMDRVISALKNKIDSGSKCFWVLPRIIGRSANDDLDSQVSSVESRYRALIDIFGENKVGFVHGRMKIDDREKKLATFADELSEMVILVGTTVIEVGIDVPNVNLLIVERAECFGLSQLHQLRGRIGRTGSRENLECHCVLLTDTARKVGEEKDSILTRLEILRETMDGAVVAEADLMLRGAGDTLGFLQSGIKSGYAVNPLYHWEMLPAASILARGFLHHFDQDSNESETNKNVNNNVSMNKSQQSNECLLNLLQQEKVKTLYDEINASSESGFVLRVMMLLFGERSNLKESLDILQQFTAVKGDLSRDDHLIDHKIAEIGEISSNSQEMTSSSGSIPLSEKTVPSKPIASLLQPRILTTKKKSVNFFEDVCFILLDVETTGLDATSSYVIQLAGKELGSRNDDEFAEYILPPVQVPENIEKLTGITDVFLRSGEYSVFKEVFLRFQDFCSQQANGRHVCFVAHNARFDIAMIESELKRWRTADKSAPVLADVFASSLDTLTLFREKRSWATSRPSSFRLEDVYSHVFNENITDAHNAVGDIRALERLLLSDEFAEWKGIANKLQKPFVKVE